MLEGTGVAVEVEAFIMELGCSRLADDDAVLFCTVQDGTRFVYRQSVSLSRLCKKLMLLASTWKLKDLLADVHFCPRGSAMIIVHCFRSC